MKVIAAYLLAVLGGNASPSADDLKDILSSVGAEADDDRIELLLTQVKGKDITELIAAGREKLASVPAGGGAVAVAAPSAGGGGAAAPAAAEPKKKRKLRRKRNQMMTWASVSLTRGFWCLYGTTSCSPVPSVVITGYLLHKKRHSTYLLVTGCIVVQQTR
ncbi:60S acidic ribosomal protein P2 [Sesamum angolense]|uniref:60S acidic ribosomal protein P2 n=1 Tax=Sesamum angolense TaxID=2727404 RepID=A0AAE1WET2_9LAMI|nr:60S acidic ribosomal protein P2 [Sesamum angolense]